LSWPENQLSAGKGRSTQKTLHWLTDLWDNAKAMQIALQGLKIAEKNQMLIDKATFWQLMGYNYSDIGNYPKPSIS